jgi:hypothetical protein
MVLFIRNSKIAAIFAIPSSFRFAVPAGLVAKGIALAFAAIFNFNNSYPLGKSG